jgi:hypothetical protein
MTFVEMAAQRNGSKGPFVGLCKVHYLRITAVGTGRSDLPQCGHSRRCCTKSFIFFATNLMMPEALESGDLVPALPECDFEALNLHCKSRVVA